MILTGLKRKLSLISDRMEPEEKDPKKNQINIELSEEIAEGVYANLAMIAHSNSEFVIDFIRLMPGVPKAKVKSRIVITPEHAKRLLYALKDNIEKYEETFGAIKKTDEAPKFPNEFWWGGRRSLIFFKMIFL